MAKIYSAQEFIAEAEKQGFELHTNKKVQHVAKFRLNGNTRVYTRYGNKTVQLLFGLDAVPDGLNIETIKYHLPASVRVPYSFDGFKIFQAVLKAAKKRESDKQHARDLKKAEKKTEKAASKEKPATPKKAAKKAENKPEKASAKAAARLEKRRKVASVPAVPTADAPQTASESTAE